jgi:hypothetical protein
MIADKDISIVVQGPILMEAKFGMTEETTKLACLRLKELFPESELILSTWEGENVEGITYDKLIFNKDPGATWFDYYDHNNLNNCNRMIVSTLAGIRAASRKYVLKVRSDLFLVSKHFLKYFDKFPFYNQDLKFVKSRILSFSMWSIRGHKTPVFTMPKPFHVSDWTYFGYKEDLLNLYTVPLIEPEFSQWFLDKCKPFSDIAPHVLWKMPPEQHINSSFFKKYIDNLHLEHTADDSNNNMEKSTQLLMNNFIVLDHSQFSFISLKHFCFQFSKQNYEWFIYHSVWLNNYYKYIDEHTFLNKMKLKSTIIIRNVYFYLVNNGLRYINAKTGAVNKIGAFLIRKYAEKKLGSVDNSA